MSAEGLKVYDLGRVALIFLGIPFSALGGYGEGDSTIKIEKQDPNFTIKRGADGSVCRSKTYSKVYKITLSLLQSATANTVLSGLALLDENADNGAGVGPTLIQDGGGLSMFEATESFLEGTPTTVEYGPQAGNREWVIWAVDGVNFVAGN